MKAAHLKTLKSPQFLRSKSGEAGFDSRLPHLKGQGCFTAFFSKDFKLWEGTFFQILTSPHCKAKANAESRKPKKQRRWVEEHRSVP